MSSYNKNTHYDSDLSDDLKNVKESISQTATHAKAKATENLQETLNTMQSKTAEMQDSVVTYVRENPVKAVGIAVVVGFIAAALLKD